MYARVIKEVCEASRQDFEEGGVDLGALELLQQVRLISFRFCHIKRSRIPLAVLYKL